MSSAPTDAKFTYFLINSLRLLLLLLLAKISKCDKVMSQDDDVSKSLVEKGRLHERQSYLHAYMKDKVRALWYPARPRTFQLILFLFSIV